jgi:DNA-binding CsgD family transcriptional regulator
MAADKYSSLTDYISKATSEYLKTPGSEIINILKEYDSLCKSIFTGLPIIFLLDYARKDFLFYSKNVKPIYNYDSQQFLEEGPEYAMKAYDENYFKIYNKNIFKINCEFLRNIPLEERSHYIFSHNTRIKCKNGNFRTSLQQNIYLQSDGMGFPLLTLGIINNVDALSYDKKIIHNICKLDGNDFIPNLKPLDSNSFYINPKEGKLTIREVEILKWMADGLISKEIAHKLHLSIHTVLNHRKHILMKTNCKNTADLIRYSISNGLI